MESNEQVKKVISQLRFILTCELFLYLSSYPTDIFHGVNNYLTNDSILEIYPYFDEFAKIKIITLRSVRYNSPYEDYSSNSNI